jgi:cytochrome c-type protein NapB
MAGVNAGACKGCHGQNWEKAALGKSKIVADMTKADIAAALKGYKAGTYGGPMKGLMKGQVAKYSDADLDAFSQTIGK